VGQKYLTHTVDPLVSLYRGLTILSSQAQMATSFEITSSRIIFPTSATRWCQE